MRAEGSTGHGAPECLTPRLRPWPAAIATKSAFGAGTLHSAGVVLSPGDDAPVRDLRPRLALCSRRGAGRSMAASLDSGVPGLVVGRLGRVRRSAGEELLIKSIILPLRSYRKFGQ